jgi:hypothetical protein
MKLQVVVSWLFANSALGSFWTLLHDVQILWRTNEKNGPVPFPAAPDLAAFKNAPSREDVLHYKRLYNFLAFVSIVVSFSVYFFYLRKPRQYLSPLNLSIGVFFLFNSFLAYCFKFIAALVNAEP